MLRLEHAQRLKQWKVVLIAVLAVGVLSGVAYFVYGWLQRPLTSRQPQQTVTQKPAPKTASVESKMLIMGDVYWGRYINDWSQRSSLKYAYPFSRLSEFERDKYDAWFANMECPLTNNPKVSSAVENTYLKFDCSPVYLAEAKKWFTGFSLGNNHTDNQGAAGFTETKQHLDENGIQYFGSYDSEDYEHLCDVIAVPTQVTMSDGSVKEGKLPMVWCGYHGVFRTPSAESVAVMGKYSTLFNVVAMPHSGAEYKPAPDQIKMTLYHAFIDGGADVVLGDHPHWVQSTEAYKGKLIVYSMGNFIFDQQGALELTRSAVVNMNVSVDASSVSDIEKWLALGETCGVYADDCLQKATEQNLKKLPLRYHFSILGSRDDGKLVHKATDAEVMSIKQRMNWSVTIKGLSGMSTGE